MMRLGQEKRRSVRSTCTERLFFVSWPPSERVQRHLGPAAVVFPYAVVRACVMLSPGCRGMPWWEPVFRRRAATTWSCSDRPAVLLVVCNGDCRSGSEELQRRQQGVALNDAKSFIILSEQVVFVNGKGLSKAELIFNIG